MSIIWREDGHQWGRLPVEMPHEAFRVTPCEAGSYVYEGEWHGECDIVIGYRNTRVEHLVCGANTWKPEVLGQGILREQRFRYGCCSHNSNAGVNVYADGGLETFDGSGWVQLEVLCHSTTCLRGWRAKRCCANGPAGTICRKVAMRALWVPLDEVPSIGWLA